ncbi:hypothetical protein PCAR4_830110 [Paraburkholderia caribensis]|nr:hypothetical protein PCAR4_830110 [Paraburkholderia caribensis]
MTVNVYHSGKHHVQCESEENITTHQAL